MGPGDDTYNDRRDDYVSNEVSRLPPPPPPRACSGLAHAQRSSGLLLLPTEQLSIGCCDRHGCGQGRHGYVARQGQLAPRRSGC